MQTFAVLPGAARDLVFTFNGPITGDPSMGASPPFVVTLINPVRVPGTNTWRLHFIAGSNPGSTVVTLTATGAIPITLQVQIVVTANAGATDSVITLE